MRSEASATVNLGGPCPHGFLCPEACGNLEELYLVEDKQFYNVLGFKQYNSLSILLATLGKPVCDLAMPRLSARRKSKWKEILNGSISGVNIDMAGGRQYVMKRKKSSFPCGEFYNYYSFYFLEFGVTY